MGEAFVQHWMLIGWDDDDNTNKNILLTKKMKSVHVMSNGLKYHSESQISGIFNDNDYDKYME